MLFHLFKTKKTRQSDEFEDFRLKQLYLLSEFQKMMLCYDDDVHIAIGVRMYDCLKNCERSDISLLKLVLSIKQFISYVGCRLYDCAISFTPEENMIFQEIKAENNRHDRIGQGRALF